MRDIVDGFSRRRTTEALIEQIYAASAGPTRNVLMGLLSALEARVPVSENAPTLPADHLREAVQAMPDGMAIWDAEDHLVAWNARFAEFTEIDRSKFRFGMPAEEFLRMLAAGNSAIKPDQIDAWVHERTIARRRADAIEWKTGSGRWLRVEHRPTPRGGLVAVSVDITDLKRNAESLTQARNEADAANKTKSEFLANMSHEIRTPLTSVIGFADLLSKLDGLPQEAQTYVQRISVAGQLLLSVINDVLDFSKLEAGQVELDPHLFDPSACVQAVVDLLAKQAADRGLELGCDLAPDLPLSVEADSSRIRQVLINLVGNAIKFTQAGRVTVAVRYSDEVSGMLRIAISDTGPGIAEDQRDRLFRRFSQIDGSVSRLHGGAGLGLAICKGLVELMGGTLGVESEVGAGSTFWFAVPARRTTPVIEREAPPDDDKLESRPVHILIVDDHAANRQLVRAMLSPQGHCFEEADNGADAVSAAIRCCFDLILMDVQMPGMDGLAATRAIRATVNLNQSTPILAFSANVQPDNIEAARSAGMDDYISKPIQPVELLTKVAMWTLSPRDETNQPNAPRRAS